MASSRWNKIFNISHLGTILTGSCILSVGFLPIFILGRNFQLPAFTSDFWPTSPALSPRASGFETLALTADTSLTLGLFIYGIGGYKNWSALTSVLPEIYLVILVLGRNWAAARSPAVGAQLELHSIVLSTVRWLCALVASAYSMWMKPGLTSAVLSICRIILLTTLVSAYFLII